MTMPRYRFLMAVGHIMAVALASLLTFAPELYGIVTMVYFVGFIAIFIFMSAKSALKSATSKEAKEIRASPVIISSNRKEVQELMFKDKKLTQELKAQFSAMGLSFIIPFIVIGMFFAYSTFVRPLFQDADTPIKFLGFLIMYEIPISFSQFMNYYVIRPRMKGFINIVRDFKVHQKGIWAPTIVLKFPLKGFRIRYSGVRKFVELIPQDKKGPAQMTMRFYTKHYDRFLEALKRHGEVRDSDIERVD